LAKATDESARLAIRAATAIRFFIYLLISLRFLMTVSGSKFPSSAQPFLRNRRLGSYEDR
jgi:hypothetical protein